MNQMSEKRFKSTLDEDTMSIMPYLVSDKEEEAFYNLQGCVDLLNEQQATITHLEKVFGINFAKRRLLERDNLVLRNENEQLRRLFEEMKQPININLTEEDEKELRKLLGLIDDE